MIDWIILGCGKVYNLPIIGQTPVNQAFKHDYSEDQGGDSSRVWVRTGLYQMSLYHIDRIQCKCLSVYVSERSLC